MINFSKPNAQKAFDHYMAEVDAAMTTGFTSKAAQKNALSLLSKAYDLVIERIQDIYLATPEADKTQEQERAYWGTPQLHQWKQKHADMVIMAFPQAGAEVELISELATKRARAKDMPIAPVVNLADPAEQMAKNLESEMTERYKANNRFDAGKELSERVKLPIGAIPFPVTNSNGTSFYRWKYYLGGKVTALQAITRIFHLLQLEADGKHDEAKPFRLSVEKSDPAALRIAEYYHSKGMVEKAINDINNAQEFQSIKSTINSLKKQGDSQ